MTGLNVVLGAISSKLDTAACMGESCKLPNLAPFSLRPELGRGYWDRVWVSTKDTAFPLPPTPTGERWYGKFLKNATRARINPMSSSPPPSFNPQPIVPQTGKKTHRFDAKTERGVHRCRTNIKRTQKRRKKGRKNKKKEIFQLTGSLSNTLGEATMRGFLKFRTICRRSKWKYCAGVVGCTTDMLTWSPSTPSSELSHIYTRRTQQILVKKQGESQYAKNPST